MRALCVAALVLAAAPVALGQSTASSRRPARDVAAGDGVIISYYREPEAVGAHTSLYIKGSYASSNWRSFIALTAIVASRGETLVQPNDVEFEILAHTYRNPCWLAADHNVVFDIDGEILNALNARYSSNIPRKGECSEGLSLKMPFEAFAKLAAGKHVQISLGPKHITLKKSHLKSLRTLREAVGKY